jgi:acetate---CoA ligase (ADP-forming)
VARGLLFTAVIRVWLDAGQEQEDMIAIDLDVAEWRRHLDTVKSLRPIFDPRSVAVIGASRDPQKVGSRILAGLKGSYAGPLYVVHPESPAIHDVQTVASIRELPRGIDLAILSVPAAGVPAALGDCAQRGVGAVVVISAGFAEIGARGRLVQDSLFHLVRDCGMRMLGPNSLGVVNFDPSHQFNATALAMLPTSGGVSLASQTGALGVAVLELAAERELGLSSFVSVGNRADISSNDLLEYWEEDPATRVILLYLESFGNPRRFAQIARRVGARKPIVAIQARRTEAGARGTGAHAASLANDKAVVSAMFEQTGVIMADTIDEMFDIAACLDFQPLPQGQRVAIVTNASGPGILAADACRTSNLSVATLLDLTASAAPAAYYSSVRSALDDTAVDALIAIYSPAETHRSADILAGIADGVAISRAHGFNQKPVLLCSMTRRRRAAPLSAGDEQLPAYMFPENAVRALSKITAYAAWRHVPALHAVAH